MSLNEDIRTAVAELLRFCLGSVNVSAYPQLGMSPPRIIIAASEGGYVDYHQGFDSAGVATVHLQLWVECEAADDVSPQMLLDAYLSPDSTDTSTIVGALESDPTLGGLVSDVRYIGARVLPLAPSGPQTAVVDVDVLLSDRG